MSPSTDQVRGLLRTTADQLPGGPLDVPVSGLLTRARKGRQRRRLAQAGAVVLAVVAAIVVPVAIVGGHSAPTSTPLPGYSVPAASASPVSVAEMTHWRWTTLPAAPIPGRASPASVWTGSQVLFWGGTSADEDRAYADGASYDPKTRQWQKMPSGPLSARSEVASVWTGSEWFIWGGVNGSEQKALGDGALYDPVTRAWRAVAPSPLAARARATALWTGGQIVVIGGATAPDSAISHAYLDAAAYDPGTNTWQRLPSIPMPAKRTADIVTAIATPTGIDAWSYWEHATSTSDGFSDYTGIMRLHYDPQSGQWHSLAETPDDDLGTPLLTGDGLIFPASAPFFGHHSSPMVLSGVGWRWSTADGTWHRLPLGPLEVNADSVWTGTALLSFNANVIQTGPGNTSHPGGAAVWDSVTNKWTELPSSPQILYGSDGVWTGTEMIEWGLMQPTHGTSETYTTGGLSFGPA